jgi:hypothetical protein
MIKLHIKKTAIATAVIIAGLSNTAIVQAANIAGTDVKLSGYIKADGMYSDYSNGEGHDLNRDFYVPSTIAVGSTDDDMGGRFDAHIKQSRFRITSNTATADGDSITGVLEMDFIVTKGLYDNERISNSYSPRVRHAFLKYKNWLVGQTWSTFMDVSSLPESLDFIGVTDGTIFVRQTMVRYSNNGFEIALENPETTVVDVGATDDNSVPDLVAAYTMKQDWGYVKVAGLLRQLSYEDGDTIDASETGMGIAISSKIKFDNGDDLRLLVNAGSGIGRYTALNAAQGAVVSASGNDLDAVDTYGYTLAYRHVWNDKSRSNFMFAALEVDVDEATMGDFTESTYSARANYLYSPTNALTVGAEVGYAKRETVSGLDGDMTRVQFSAKYAF